MLLVPVFGLLALYGLVQGKVGLALFSLLLGTLYWLGYRFLSKRDAAAEATQAHAKAETDTLEELDRQACECSRSKF